MNASRLLTSLALPLALAASGCAIYGDDDERPPAEPQPPLLTMVATAAGDGVTVIEVCVQPDATLCEPSGALEAESDGQRIELPYREEPRYQLHRGELDGDAAGKEIIISYTNAEAGIDAPSSRVTLPVAPVPTAPAEGSTIALDEDVVVTWEPEARGDSIAWVHRGTCTGASDRTWSTAGPEVEGDPGQVVLTAAAMGVEAGETCAVEVEIFRTREGEADPALVDGLIVAHQARAVHFTVGP